MDGEEIVDHNFSDKLDFPDEELTDALKAGTLVLVRTVGNDHDGVFDRTWAYAKSLTMPTYFQNAFNKNGTKVPSKFHGEFNRRVAALHESRSELN